MNGMAFYPSMGKMERYRIDPVSFETVTARCTNRDCGRALNAEITEIGLHPSICGEAMLFRHDSLIDCGYAAKKLPSQSRWGAF
jgi:hypothetical protein